MSDYSVKQVLISNIGIPSKKIGSWNIMLTNLIDSQLDIFDYIISPEPDYSCPELKNIPLEDKPKFHQKLRSKLYNNKHLLKKQYWSEINAILKYEDKLILNIIDNINVLNAINYYAIKYDVRERIFINYFFHGYYFNTDQVVFNGIPSLDKLILLTNSSYNNLLKVSNEIPFEISILPNGIKSQFTSLTENEKVELRNELGYNDDKIYFLWLSQDRPKKGLKIILRAWKELIKRRNNIELIIIGTDKKFSEGTVHYLGKIPNHLLPKYYQIVDYYLFSTLCKEGHSLSLTEALKSGLKCLASDITPTNEILKGGNLGYLVKHPNMIKSWINAVDYVLNTNYNFNKKNINLDNIYDFDTWKNEFFDILNQSKQSII